MRYTITQYDELGQYVDAFVNGNFHLLIIEGRAGTGKTEILKEGLKHMTPNEYGWITGRLSPVFLFNKLYDLQDKPIILDDTDGIYREKESVNLLKCLCQTTEDKLVTWQTSTRLVPVKEFRTKSRLLLVSNDWKQLNKHVGAIIDRGILIDFVPSPFTVFNRARQVFDHAIYGDILDFIAKYLPVVKEPTLRDVYNARQTQLAGLCWQSPLIQSFGLNTSEQIVIELDQITGLSVNERGREYAKLTGKLPENYERIRREFLAKGCVMC